MTTKRKNWIIWCALFIALPAMTGAKTSPTEVQCRVELDRPVLPADTTQTTVIKIALDAPVPPKREERPAVNLTVVLDRSGSMAGSKIEKAREAAIEALRRLDDRDIFSVVIYDDVVETLVPAQSAANTEWIENRIRSIQSRNNTALFAGVSQGAAEVRKHIDRPYVHRIILLSDGLANVGPSSPDDLARLGVALRKENISVTTVGVGTDYNEDLMTRLAETSDGNTYFVESSRDLPRIFAAELGDLLSVVANDVNMRLECPEGIRPLRIVGRDGRIHDNQVDISLNQLYGGQEEYVLIEIEVQPAKAGEVRKVATAHCTYQDAVTQKTQTVSSYATARFSERKEEVKRAANREVQRDVAVNEAALTKDKVIGLSDEGKLDEAVQELRQQSSVLYRLGDDYDNPALKEKGAELEREADELKAEGMSKSRRKRLRAETWQEPSAQKVR